jgi:TPR repeat protein
MRSACQLLLWTALTVTAGAVRADLETGLAAVERRDWAAALAEFRPLADRGVADAQVNLGNLYMKGWGLTQNYGEAFRWYLKAAGQGSVIGQGKLGLMHYYGLGVPEDHAEAARWFREAGEKGEPSAAFILGSLYAAGDGVEKDKVQAYVWYTLAAEHGRRDALDSRNGLVDEMSPGEINEALTWLATWRDRHEPRVEADAGHKSAKAKTSRPKRPVKIIP